MTTTNHYIGKLRVRSGDCETTTVFRFTTTGNPDNYVNRVAKTWYGGKAENDGGIYLFDAGCIAVTPESAHAVPKDVYDALRSIVSEINLKGK